MFRRGKLENKNVIHNMKLMFDFMPFYHYIKMFSKILYMSTIPKFKNEYNNKVTQIEQLDIRTRRF